MYTVTVNKLPLSLDVPGVNGCVLIQMFLTDLWQTPPTQSQPETPLQSELLPELTGSAQSPPGEHIVTPPSTVDTAALSEEPLPGEDGAGFKPRH